MGHLKIAPSEFWKMCPSETLILIEANRPKHVGGIHEDELERMHKKRAELEAQGIEVM